MAEFDPAEKARDRLRDWKCGQTPSPRRNEYAGAPGEGSGAAKYVQSSQIGIPGEDGSEDNLLLSDRPAATSRRPDAGSRAACRDELVRTIARMGYPESFGTAIADQLRTEKMMTRMTAYLHAAHPRSAEEIADEMLAIMEDRERWIKKKSAEYYNSKYNELLYYGLPDDEED